ncbi:hypothetical protein QJS10_CPB12g00774 [Acorus calamus]|uniref:Uncharacterized protein n=1 Tax=Acorus calamus TaxID=4465 RepID=A0AAV9DM72_ACOCL|nr:hypothetical protein QJS10_CPB12g00774 [Acorus calamus]
MTITLDDVTQIVGIPVMGKAIYGSTSMDIDEAAEPVKECLNLSMTEIREDCVYTMVWVYEHLPLIGPIPNPTYTDESPQADRWIRCRNNLRLQKNLVEVIWELLDMTTLDQMEFDPYRTIQDRRPLLDYAFFKGYKVLSK